MSMNGSGKKATCLLLALTLSSHGARAVRAEDWPQFRGPNRDGVWSETGIMENFPAEGLKIRWRAPIGSGNASPVVAGSRAYVTDLETQKPEAWERVHCFGEKTGKPLWIYRDLVTFPQGFDPQNPGGPCPTPIVEAESIYTLGGTGHLLCLDSRKGTLVWKKNLINDYGLSGRPNLTPCPLIEGNLLIVVIGGKPGACVVAFDKRTGVEVWRALGDPPHAFSSPIVISAGGERQLIVWTPSAVTSLNPATGKTWWREALITREDNAGAAPVFLDNNLLISGPMFRLESDKPAATAIWPERKAQSLRILSGVRMPMIQGEEIYAARMSGSLICLDTRTGAQLWETDMVTGQEKYGAIHLTPNGDSVLLYTDQGNLIRARLTRSGYHELSRVHLLDPTYFVRGRKLVWTPPAYANGHVFARSNGRELICASLASRP